jgi:hypothetical protein
VESQPEPGLVLATKGSGASAVERRKFPLPMIAAAIINYCRQGRIPLPRQAKKTLEIVPEGFAFTVETTVELLRRHSALPAAAKQPAAGQTEATAQEQAQPPAGKQDEKE